MSRSRVLMDRWKKTSVTRHRVIRVFIPICRLYVVQQDLPRRLFSLVAWHPVNVLAVILKRTSTTTFFNSSFQIYRYSWIYVVWGPAIATTLMIAKYITAFKIDIDIATRLIIAQCHTKTNNGMRPQCAARDSHDREPFMKLFARRPTICLRGAWHLLWTDTASYVGQVHTDRYRTWNHCISPTMSSHLLSDFPTLLAIRHRKI